MSNPLQEYSLPKQLTKKSTIGNIPFTPSLYIISTFAILNVH